MTAMTNSDDWEGQHISQTITVWRKRGALDRKESLNGTLTVQAQLNKAVWYANQPPSAIILVASRISNLCIVMRHHPEMLDKK